MNKFFIFTVISVVFAFTFSSCGGDDQPNAKKISQNIDTLLMQNPDSVAILVKHGLFYYEKLDFYKAVPSATKAFRLDSSDLEVRMLYAEVLNNRPNRTLKDVITAQRNFNYVIEKEPRNTKALVGIASTFTMMQDFDRSFQYINEALKIDNKYRDAYILKGTNYLQNNNIKLAKSSYETATQQDPEFYQAYIALGDLYASEENEIAIQYYITAAELKPDDVGVLYKLAYARQSFGQFDEAQAVYREMFQKDETFAMSLFQQGFIKHIHKGEIDSAMIYYNQAVVIEPKFVEAWHNIGLCWEEKGNRAKALQSYSRALKINPDYTKSREAAEKLR